MNIMCYLKMSPLTGLAGFGGGGSSGIDHTGSGGGGGTAAPHGI